MSRLFHFFYDNLPSLGLTLALFPFIAAWILLSLYVAGKLKRDRNWPTGYTRKVVHICVFLSAALVQYCWKLPGVFIFGWAITAVTLWIIWKGDGNLLYEAVAREKDAPQRSLHLVLPYIATFCAGVLSNLLFPTFITATGYLVTGLGDAAGEPVGTRWGRHKYPVISLKNVVAYRTLEGSVGVLAASFIALLLGYLLWPDAPWTIMNTFKLGIVALGCTVIEALAPHGTDNFFSQFGACLLLSAMF